MHNPKGHTPLQNAQYFLFSFFFFFANIKFYLFYIFNVFIMPLIQKYVAEKKADAHLIFQWEINSILSTILYVKIHIIRIINSQALLIILYSHHFVVLNSEIGKCCENRKHYGFDGQ
jgi:hypothetical protein